MDFTNDPFNPNNPNGPYGINTRIKADAARQKQQADRHTATISGMLGINSGLTMGKNASDYRMGRIHAGKDPYTGEPYFKPKENPSSTSISHTSGAKIVGSGKETIKPGVNSNPSKHKRANPEDIIRKNVRAQVYALSADDGLLFYYLNNEKRLERSQALLSSVFSASHLKGKAINELLPEELEKTLNIIINNGLFQERLISTDPSHRQAFYDWHDDFKAFAKKATIVKQWNLMKFQLKRLNDDLSGYRKSGAYASFMDNPENLKNARQIFSTLFVKGSSQSNEIMDYSAIEIAVAIKKSITSGDLKEKLFYTDKDTREKFFELCSGLNKHAVQHERKQQWKARKQSLTNTWNAAKKVSPLLIAPLSFITNASLALGAGILAISLATSNQSDSAPDSSVDVPPAAAPTANDFTHFVATQNDPLTVRQNPSVMSEKVYALPKGECVQATITVMDDWSKIDLPNDKIGYVAERFLRPITPNTPCPN